jgi:DNA-binding IclR family transcriptional regulator
VRDLAEEAVASLATELRESVVAAQVHKGTRYTVAQASFSQALMVDMSLQARGTFYNSATGRVLLAHMDSADLAATVSRYGIPGSEMWPEASAKAGFARELSRIREAREAAVSVAGGTVQFFAVPVFGPDGRVWLALGVSLPSIRFVPPHSGTVVSALHRKASELADQLEMAEGESA